MNTTIRIKEDVNINNRIILEKGDIIKVIENRLSESSEVADFVKEINTLRLRNKNNWYQWVGKVQGKKIEIKGYGTWLQIFRVDGVQYGGLMDIPISVFKSELEKPFKR